MPPPRVRPPTPTDAACPILVVTSSALLDRTHATADDCETIWPEKVVDVEPTVSRPNRDSFSISRQLTFVHIDKIQYYAIFDVLGAKKISMATTFHCKCTLEELSDQHCDRNISCAGRTECASWLDIVLLERPICVWCS